MICLIKFSFTSKKPGYTTIGRGVPQNGKRHTAAPVNPSLSLFPSTTFTLSSLKNPTATEGLASTTPIG